MSGQEERDISSPVYLDSQPSFVQASSFTRRLFPVQARPILSVSSVERYEEGVEKVSRDGEAKSWLRERAWWMVGWPGCSARVVRTLESEGTGYNCRLSFFERKRIVLVSGKGCNDVEAAATFTKPRLGIARWHPCSRCPNILSVGNLASLGRVWASILDSCDVDTHDVDAIIGVCFR
ncbi:hypothetical protein EDC04DRAFT_1407661 [Pisolithus marmoratus]|nr:hypothetical protein EDC04DRAFT_1407661 [Pisolithus marmoratus]